MTPDTIKNIIMVILLVAGMALLMKAKVSFQRRQQTAPDNAWSPRENQMRMIGYGILIADVLIAGFVKV